MSDIKKSDKWMGRLGMLQSLIVIFAAYMLTGVLIDIQEDLNELAKESLCADSWFGCTEEEEKELNEFVDYMQEKVVVWQAAWGFGVIVGIYFFYASFRLTTGPDHWVPLRGVVSSKVPALNLSDRQFFIYTTVAVSLILFGIGYLETDTVNDLFDKIDEMSETETGEEDRDKSPTSSNGFVVGYCNTAFLFLILIIAYFGRDKPGSEESGTAENMLNLEGDSSDIGNDDSLELAITSEEKTDEE